MHREACYCSQHAAFGRWVNSNNFQPRSSYFLFFFRCISQITPRPKQRIQTTTETAIKGQKLERYEPSPVSLIRRFRPSAAPLLSPAPAKAAVSSDMFRPDVLLSLIHIFFARSPKPRQSFPGTKDLYTHLTTPSAGRTGSVLTCLINFLFTNENGVCYTSKTVPLMQYDMERRAASPRDRE